MDGLKEIATVVERQLPERALTSCKEMVGLSEMTMDALVKTIAENKRRQKECADLNELHIQVIRTKVLGEE